ncbi:SMP-30/gluconolactonase/LRE family protein [Paraburkholderia sp. RP-4-7]|uniref:SMP-30/gluconolactonase/LRE family protein n=1 Tax=Paraburkholderia polaris TaxID=2728848 RepID=A0A848IUM9_9BURK|nr:SMP-30/gluconolactonase/LRE family protein [Paraburkholderia polaris]NMM03899.1 SMP-30/gluconolactonase/LRE family protein [Paraburkholderia polaris]
MSENVSSVDAEMVFPTRMDLGEGPLWDPAGQSLYWTDLINQKLFKGNPSTGRYVERNLPYKASRVTHCSDGRLLVSFTRGLASGTFDGQAFAPLTPGFSLPKEVRINDGACDAQGRFWTGTYDPTLRSAIGCLYCVEHGRVSTKTEGVMLSNGIRFSPDNRTMYFVETSPARLWAYEYELSNATLGKRRLVVDYSGIGARPDGCAIDTDGCLWVAEVDRGRIARYAPDGKLDQVVRVPVLKPTSVCFGGRENNVLFITSRYAGVESGEQSNPLAGAVFAAQVNATGLPEHRYAHGE